MSEGNVIPMHVKPKHVSERYNGQKIVLRFCPDAASETKRWQWQVVVTREYTFTGDARSEALARLQAKRKIEEMCGSAAAKKVV